MENVIAMVRWSRPRVASVEHRRSARRLRDYPRHPYGYWTPSCTRSACSRRRVRSGATVCSALAFTYRFLLLGARRLRHARVWAPRVPRSMRSCWAASAACCRWQACSLRSAVVPSSARSGIRWPGARLATAAAGFQAEASPSVVLNGRAATPQPSLAEAARGGNRSRWRLPRASDGAPAAGARGWRRDRKRSSSPSDSGYSN